MTDEHVPTRRRVARAIRAGEPDVLSIAEEELRPLKVGEALVRVEAAGLNHVDSLVRFRPEDLAAFTSEALALATTRPLVSDVAARLPLNRVADAYRALDSGVSGKVLVLPHAA